MKLLFALLLLSIVLGKHIHPYNVDRIIIIANVKNFSSTTDTILDVNHTAFRALGLYDDAYIENWDVKTFNHFNDQFGLDFSQAVPGVTPGTLELKNSTTGLTLATLYPYKYIVNNTYRVQLDTMNVERGEGEGLWYNNAFGNLALMSGSGTYPGGVAVGTKYYPGDILSYVFYQLMKEGEDISNPKYREQIQLSSEYAARQVPDAFGIFSPYIRERAYNEDGEPGMATISTYPNRNYANPLLGKTITLSILSFPEWKYT